ncbi:MAG TPA: hypothetical protein EYN66_09395 [Myxococcales bacterium]|nr:hypothetical protein [Myxococcales bacterium]
MTRLSADSEMNTTSSGSKVAAVKDAQSLEPLTHLISQASDINHHPHWSLALVTGMGSDNVLVLNTNEVDPMRSPLGIIEVGQAPKAVTFSDDGLHAYVLNSHSFKVSRVDLSPFFSMASSAGEAVGIGSMDQLVDTHSDTSGLTDPIRLEHNKWAVYGKDPLDKQLRQGRRIYTHSRNQKISHGGKFACASCHVEGEEDGLVWFIPGGMRQTPALAGRLANTAPFNWGGTEVELTNNMSKTIDRMGGEGFEQSELKALEAYLLFALVPPPNPHVASGSLTPAQSRGHAIFNSSKAECATCHAGAAHTDGKNYDVGTLNDLEKQVAEMASGLKSGDEIPQATKDVLAGVTGTFNTPTLIDLHATAPYLHDGSAATLMDVLDRTATSMGHSDHLTHSEKEDLVAYLLTL